MIKYIVALFVVISAVVIGLSIYLSPDDLANCGQRPSKEEMCKPADAIVAISGGDTTTRTSEAIKLYKNGWAKTIIFSGAAKDKTGPSNAEAMRRLAVSGGVPTDNIIMEEFGETTKENAGNTKALVDQYKISSIILVTSAYHQRRASLEFIKNLPDTVIRNSPAYSDNQWSIFWWFTPFGWFLAISEFIKVLFFYIGGVVL